MRLVITISCTDPPDETQVVQVGVLPSDTIREVKERVWRTQQLPGSQATFLDRSRVVFDGRQLSDAGTLTDFKIQSRSVLYISWDAQSEDLGSTDVHSRRSESCASLSQQLLRREAKESVLRTAGMCSKYKHRASECEEKRRQEETRRRAAETLAEKYRVSAWFADEQRREERTLRIEAEEKLFQADRRRLVAELARDLAEELLRREESRRRAAEEAASRVDKEIVGQPSVTGPFGINMDVRHVLHRLAMRFCRRRAPENDRDLSRNSNDAHHGHQQCRSPCTICMVELPEVMVEPCAHVCICVRCFADRRCHRSLQRCPICRTVAQRLRLIHL